MDRPVGDILPRSYMTCVAGSLPLSYCSDYGRIRGSMAIHTGEGRYDLSVCKHQVRGGVAPRATATHHIPSAQMSGLIVMLFEREVANCTVPACGWNGWLCGSEPRWNWRMTYETRRSRGIDWIDSPGMYLGQIRAGMTVQAHLIGRKYRMIRCDLGVEGVC